MNSTPITFYKSMSNLYYGTIIGGRSPMDTIGIILIG